MKIKSVLLACVLGISSVGIMTTMSGCGLISAGVNKYDRLVELDENANRMWADYESALQRRSDMIPQMVAVVKGAAGHEHSTLKDVIDARSRATQITLNADDLTDPAKVEAFKEAQKGLSGALSKLMMITENYPQLNATSQFHDLSVSIEGTENRILVARRDYNAAASTYNVELRRVSGQALQVVIGNKTFRPRVFFSADPGAKNAPVISFDSPTPTSSAK